MFFKFFSEGLMKRLSPTTGRICAVSDMLPDSLTEEQVYKKHTGCFHTCSVAEPEP
jgi:hypothetical protein